MPLLFAPVSACPGGGTLPAFASAASQQAAAARDEPAGEPGDEGAAVQRQRTDALLSALPNGVVMRALDGRLMPLTEWPALRAMALGHGLGSQLMGVLSPAGKLHWLMVNMELIRDAHALPAGTVACFTDVTEQRSQQALLSHVVEAAGVGTWERDMDADSMVCNDRLWRMLGYRRGDVGPTLSAWNHLVHPDSPRRLGCRVARPPGQSGRALPRRVAHPAPRRRLGGGAVLRRGDRQRPGRHAAPHGRHPCGHDRADADAGHAAPRRAHQWADPAAQPGGGVRPGAAGHRPRGATAGAPVCGGWRQFPWPASRSWA